jgi:2-succinyl-5-enolpyruvyl-6-hydroxy-3-cyclohexene-1-carboxylate synthase
MTRLYSSEKQALIVVSLLKQHGIRKVIASPGTTNCALIWSMQHDGTFEMYSCVDERSAAYMACGMAAESGEPVVISCTGATASRNYLPGLTEAYYRKLPVVAITSTQSTAKVGQLVAQVIDRSSRQPDVARVSVNLPIVKDDEDTWECEVKVNRALHELRRCGGGPVHINLPTTYSRSYDVDSLPNYRAIRRITPIDPHPPLPPGPIAVFIGAHEPWSGDSLAALDAFCDRTGAVVVCDHTSGYQGRHRVLGALIAGQVNRDNELPRPHLVIHVGEVTGDYYGSGIGCKEVWRVSPDGEIRDPFKRLSHVFESSESEFFRYYAGLQQRSDAGDFLRVLKAKQESLQSAIPPLPFSNVWLASAIAPHLPPGSVVHFGILNSLRSWNFFPLPQGVASFSNVGGFGIDGALSTLLGAALCNPRRLYFCVLGDLAFFYDMNALGNRHLPPNIRIILVNNGKGTEFRQFGHHAADFGDDADVFVSAGGHFGAKSPALARSYCEALGFEYVAAADKNAVQNAMSIMCDPQIGHSPRLLEVFTNSTDESKALEIMLRLGDDMSSRAKAIAKQFLGQKSVDVLRRIVK